MTDTPRTILDDQRPISALWEAYEQGGCYRVGHLGVEKIVAYGEPGEFMMLPWFAVYKGGEVYVRVPAQNVIVEYQNPPALEEGTI